MPTYLGIAALLSVALGVTGGAGAQRPAPMAEVAALKAPSAWLDEGFGLLEREDPLAAWRVFYAAQPIGAELVERSLGLGRSYLMLDDADRAIELGELAVVAAPERQDVMALTVRSLIRSRRFDDAARRSRRYVARSAAPTADLLAARGSALYRVHRPSDAADFYRRAVALDQDHAEAHLRLGTGLSDPVVVSIPAALRDAVEAIGGGQLPQAIDLLQLVLHQHPGHPIAHRLLGESLFAGRAASSMAMQNDAFRRVAQSMPAPKVDEVRLIGFVPAYGAISESRRRVVARIAAVFGSRLQKLVQVGGRHDLLVELERTTDAAARRNLRGRRTFDGRVWDDVRGVGGLRAATGIEALDEAAAFGFDTFAHEVAHQVHFFTFSPLERARLRALYKLAISEHRCLDYYAASNEAEYFGQGVEAYVSLAKRPGSETTHGHTRWELKRVDPKLYAFIEGLVDFDPLRDAARRQRLLTASVEVAIRCGRPADALVAASMLEPSAARVELLAAAEKVQHELRLR